MLATEMNVRRVLANRCCRKAEDPLRIRIPVRQPARNQPVKYTIERNAINRRLTERQLDLTVR